MKIVDAASLQDYVGRSMGQSEWFQIDQDRINAFADSTLDHQFIHVDPEQAKHTPFGGTIAHGFLTLSLLPHLQSQMSELVIPAGLKMGMNYGFDKMLPALLYYLKVESNDVIAYKIGVTNRSVAERFYSELDKITVLYTEHFDKGIDALHEEKKILAEYSENKYDGLPLLTSGNTELFVCDVLRLEL